MLLYVKRFFTADHIGLNKTIIRTGTTRAGRKMAALIANTNQTNTVIFTQTTIMRPTVAATFVSKIRVLIQRSITDNLSKDLLIGLKSVTVLRLT